MRARNGYVDSRGEGEAHLEAVSRARTSRFFILVTFLNLLCIILYKSKILIFY